MEYANVRRGQVNKYSAEDYRSRTVHYGEVKWSSEHREVQVEYHKLRMEYSAAHAQNRCNTGAEELK